MQTYDYKWERFKRTIHSTANVYDAPISVSPNYSTPLRATGNVALALTDQDVIAFTISESLCPDNDYTIGNLVSNTIELTLNNMNDAFENNMFIGKHISVGLSIDADAVITASSASAGHFMITESRKDKTAKQIILKGVDFVSYYGSNTIWSDSDIEGTYPYGGTLNDVITRACDFLGIAWAGTNKYQYGTAVVTPNKTKSMLLTADTTFPGVTIREAIGYMAALAGCNAIVNRSGELEFRYPYDYATLTPLHTGFPIQLDEDTFYNLDMEESDSLEIASLMFSGGENNVYTRGSITAGTRGLLVSNNHLCVGTKPGDFIDGMYAVVDGIKYRPFTMTARCNPSIECGSKVALSLYENNAFIDYNSFIESLKMTYAGGLKVEYTTRATVGEDVYGDSYGQLVSSGAQDPVQVLSDAIGGPTVKVEQSTYDTFVSGVGTYESTTDTAISDLATFAGKLKRVCANQVSASAVRPHALSTNHRLLEWTTEIIVPTDERFEGVSTGDINYRILETGCTVPTNYVSIVSKEITQSLNGDLSGKWGTTTVNGVTVPTIYLTVKITGYAVKEVYDAGQLAYDRLVVADTTTLTFTGGLYDISTTASVLFTTKPNIIMYQ